MNHNEMIAVIAAHRDGKKIEVRAKAYVAGDEKWNTCTVIPYDFQLFEYRIAVEPRRCWVKWDLDGALIYRKYEEVQPDVSKEFGWQLVVEEIK